MTDKEMIEEMAKLDIEESAGFYSAFINDMRISKNKPLSISKTVMSFDCSKKYILQAIGIPEGSVVLSKEEYERWATWTSDRKVFTQTEFYTRLKYLTAKARKETAREIFAWLKEHCDYAGFAIIEAYFKDTFGNEINE